MVIENSFYPSIPYWERDPEILTYLKQQDNIWDRSTTLQTRCIADQIAMVDLNFYTNIELHDLYTGRMEYSDFKAACINRFVTKYTRLFNDPRWKNKAQNMEGHALSGAMLDIYDLYREKKFSVEKAVEKLGDYMFPTFTMDKDLTCWVTRIQYKRKTLIKRLKECVTENRSTFNITKIQTGRIVSGLNKEDFGPIRKLMASTLQSKIFYKKGLPMWSGLPVGLGSVLFSVSVSRDVPYSRDLQGWRDGLLDFSFNDSLLYYITNFDLTIIAHGDPLVVTANDWYISPVKLYTNFKEYHSASNLLLAAFEDPNVTTINLLACNPNKVKLLPKLYSDKNHCVEIYSGNVFIG